MRVIVRGHGGGELAVRRRGVWCMLRLESEEEDSGVRSNVSLSGCKGQEGYPRHLACGSVEQIIES